MKDRCVMIKNIAKSNVELIRQDTAPDVYTYKMRALQDISIETDLWWNDVDKGEISGPITLSKYENCRARQLEDLTQKPICFWVDESSSLQGEFALPLDSYIFNNSHIGRFTENDFNEPINSPIEIINSVVDNVNSPDGLGSLKIRRSAIRDIVIDSQDLSDTVEFTHSAFTQSEFPIKNIVMSDGDISKLEYLPAFNLYDGLIDLDNIEKGDVYGIN